MIHTMLFYAKIITCWLLLPVWHLQAQPEIPYLSGRVNDYAQLMSESGQQQLASLLQDHEQRTTNQIAVLTIPSLENADLADFAVRTSETWQLGQEGKDNGVLLVVAAEDRQLRIEVGYGLEPYLTDAEASRIIREVIVPHFRSGDYEAGIIAGTQAIVNKIEGIEELSTPSGSADSGFRGYGVLGLLLTVCSVLVGYFLVKKHRRNAPRKSKKTGLPMRKLSEAEEDPHLDRGQQVEEAIGSVDYDVWVSGQPQDVLVLPYKNSFNRKYAPCPHCGYLTFYHTGSTVLRSATYARDGEGKRSYECKYCHHTETRTYRIPRVRKTHTVIVPGAGGRSWGGGSGFSGRGGSFGGGGASGSW